MCQPGSTERLRCQPQNKLAWSHNTWEPAKSERMTAQYRYPAVWTYLRSPKWSTIWLNPKPPNSSGRGTCSLHNKCKRPSSLSYSNSTIHSQRGSRLPRPRDKAELLSCLPLNKLTWWHDTGKPIKSNSITAQCILCRPITVKKTKETVL